MALISAGNQAILNGMCQGAKNVLLGDLLVAQQNAPVVNGDVVITTSGATVALTAAKNVGINAIVQAKPAAAAIGGSLYLVSFDQVYAGLKSVSINSIGQVPGVNSVQVVGNGVAGGVAVITFASVANTNTFVLSSPVLSAAVTLTATTSTNGNKQFSIASSDANAATACAAMINRTTATSSYVSEFVTFYAASGVMPFSAYAIGAAVVIVSNFVGATILSALYDSTITVATDIVHIAATARTMQPGVVLQSAVGVTPTVMVTGDEYQLRFGLSR